MRRLYLASLLATLLLTSCGGVLSDHGLSTEADSALDERLIGWWESVSERVEPDVSAPRLVIGRLPDTKHTLEVVLVQLDDSGHIDVQRRRLFATVIGTNRYLSLTDDKQAEFLLLKYSVSAEGALQVSWLDDAKTAKEIEAGRVKGTAEKNPKYAPLSTEAEYNRVRLQAAKEALRAWLAKAGASAWSEKGVRFRKLKLGEPALEK